jgi:hypothetical protein
LAGGPFEEETKITICNYSEMYVELSDQPA